MIGRPARSRVPGGVMTLVDERDEHRDVKTGAFLGHARGVHHRQALSDGGRHIASNLVTVQGKRSGEGTHPWAHASIDAIRWGYSVPAWIEDPSQVPIKMIAPGGAWRWFLLTDDGSKLYVRTLDAHATMIRLGLREAVDA